jgi:hypothetical protein
MRILDVHGLVDRHIARQPFHTGIGKIGHEKADFSYILERQPRFLYVPDYIRSLTEKEYEEVVQRYRSTRGRITPENGKAFTVAYFEWRG